MRATTMHPDRFLSVTACVMVAIAGALALVVAPPDAVQGQAQRLMYVHVPAAWTGYLGFCGVLLASLVYLRRGSMAADRCALACAELGVAMTVLAIAVGSLWGRATWGTWWAWDARLVTTALMVLVYLAYLIQRRLGRDRTRTAKRSAIFGVAAFAVLPVVHFSVLWWRTLHQPPTILAPDPTPPIAPVMALTLACSGVAFTLMAAWAVRARLHRLRRSTPVTVSARRQKEVVPSATG